MGNIQAFLVANPIGIMALAIGSAAAYDFLKRLFALFLRPKDDVGRDIEFTLLTLKDYENRLINIRISFEFMKLFVCGIVFLLMCLTIILGRVSPNYTEWSITFLLKPFVFCVMFVNMLIFTRSATRLMQWHFTLIDIGGVLKKLAARVSVVPAPDRQPLIDQLEEASNIARGLKLII